MKLTRRTRAQINSPIGAHSHLIGRVPADQPLLDLSQGAPGFPPAPEVVARVAEAAASPDGGRYAPLRGLPELRTAFAEELSAVYRGLVTADDVCITAGCNQAFCVVTSALAEPGDEVILTLPYYFNHDMWLGLDGVTRRYLRPGDGVNPTVADAEPLLTDRTRALVLVTPGNPTGLTLAPAIIDSFASFAAAHDVVLIIDETYRSFVPGDGPPHRLFERPTWRDHVVSLHSFSKDLAIPGYRVGAVVGHAELLTEVAKLLDCVSICAPRIGQEAALAGLTLAREWRDSKVADIAERRAAFESSMSAQPGGYVLHSSGAYYGWVQHPFRGASSEQVARHLILDHGVLVIPGSAFMPDDPPMLRFSFANVDLDRLAELATRLEASGRSSARRRDTNVSPEPT